jgi:C-terminal processing protease CtpA/Prc
MRVLLFLMLSVVSIQWISAQTHVNVKIKKENNGETIIEEKSFELKPGEDLDEALKRNGIDKKGAKEFSIQIEDKSFSHSPQTPGATFSIEGLPFIDIPMDVPNFRPRAYLGVTLKNGKHHPVVSDISPNSPAEKARLQVGDEIKKVDGSSVHNSQDIVNIIREKSPQEVVELKVKRHGKNLKMNIPLEALPNAPLVDDFPTFPFGNFPEMRIEEFEIDEKPSAFLGVTPNNEFADMGVKIDSVIANSAAEKMGLKKYDVIIALNGKAVQNFDELRKIIGESIPGDGCEVTIIRDEKTSIIKGNFGGKSLIERDGYRIYRNEKGLDDQGQINLDYEFDMDDLEQLDSTLQIKIMEDGMIINSNMSSRQLSLHKISEETLSLVTKDILSPSDFDQLSFVPQPKTESLDIQLSSSKAMPIRVVVQDKENGIVFSDERPKPISEYKGMIRYAGWNQGSYYLLIYQNEKLVIAKELQID